MDFRHNQTQLESLPQCLVHRYRCRHRLHRRDQIRLHWISFSTRRNLLRSDSLGDGGAAPEFCRVQDGPPCLLVLLRPGLRRYELLCLYRV